MSSGYFNLERIAQNKEQIHASRDRFASNSAVARSQPVRPLTTFSTPSRSKRMIQPDTEEDDESDDDDFKKPPIIKAIKLPIKHTAKKQKNPFAKKSCLLPLTPSPFSSLDVDNNDNDMDDFRPPQTLTMAPKRNVPKKNLIIKNQEKQTILNSLHAHKKQQDNNKDKVKCPYCPEILYPMRDNILKALKVIELKDKKHRETEMKLMDKEEEEGGGGGGGGGFNMIKTRYISAAEKDEFCQLHHKELVVIPEGRVKGYPLKIDFDLIPKRINDFSDELKDIIKKNINSHYRNIAEEAYKEQGVTQARSTMSIIQRFHWSLPGYYGPKGSAVIIQALSDLYLNTGYLKKNLVSQQLPLEFIQQVLVPEAGVRLIRQDLHKKSGPPPPNCTLKAKQIMIDSCDYGSIVFPLDQPHID